MEKGEILFANKGHELFYQKQTESKRYFRHPKFKAFFYLMGLHKETRKHIGELFDFKDAAIRPDGLYCDWHDTESLTLVRLGFNLFKGWTEQKLEFLSSPHYLFDSRLAPYLVQALLLRYPYRLNRYSLTT